MRELIHLAYILFHFTGQKGIDLESLDRTHFIPEAAYNKDQGSYNRHPRPPELNEPSSF
jgi:hypothetical protein